MDQQKKVKILFLCTGNSCRSQMAEAFARELRGDRIEAYSAGTEPKGVDPRTVKAMKEAGIDISGQSSKNVNDCMDIEYDFVITVCGHANETCPFFPGKTQIVHKGFEDPPLLAADARNEEEAMLHYRRVRDEIREYVLTVPEALTVEKGMLKI